MNVYDAAVARLKIIFEEFDNIVVSFSGGKDSGVMLNLTLDYMRENGIHKKIGVYHLDYEAQYTATTKYVEKMITSNLDLINPYWCCIPVAAGSACSMYSDHWIPWNPDEKEIWTRELPNYPFVITDDNNQFDFDYYGIWDYDFNLKFEKWIHKKNNANKTCFLIGIREQESLQRYAAIHKKYKMYKHYNWTSVNAQDIYAAYPIHDWKTEDIWIANSNFGWDYNELYDLYYQAGLSINEMRVASPFILAGKDNLSLYRVIEPEKWAQLVGRVNGANFMSIYAGTSAVSKNIKLPDGHTWKSYCEFLLSTLPKYTRDRFIKKFNKSLEYWTKSGGALRLEVIDELKEKNNIKFDNLGAPVDNRKRNGKHEVVRFKEYPDDVNVSDFAAVPSYKRMCITILKNDYACKYMGFGLTKIEMEKRKKALEKYKNL